MKIYKADLANPAHAADFIALMSMYALDPMGGGKELSTRVKADLPAALAARESCVSFIAGVEEKPAGLITCMEGFSTFSCQPLLNIHDVIVRGEFRGRNIAGQLLARAEQEAIERGCCKLTLEVLAENRAAQKAYVRAGYAPYVLDRSIGAAQFWQKVL